MCVKSEQGMPNMSNLSIRMPLRIDKPINVMSKETLRQMAYEKGEKALKSMGLPGDLLSPKNLPEAESAIPVSKKLLTKNNIFKFGEISFLVGTAAILAKYIYNTCQQSDNTLS